MRTAIADGGHHGDDDGERPERHRAAAAAPAGRPTTPPTNEPIATTSGDRPVDVTGGHEQQRRHEVRDQGEGVLQGVGLLDVGLVERTDQGEQDHALRGPEVAAVDRGEADADGEQAEGALVRPTPLEPRVDPRLYGRQGGGQEQQERHQLLEGLGGQRQERGRRRPGPRPRRWRPAGSSTARRPTSSRR